MERLTKSYKGYRIELTPGGDYCAQFSADIHDGSGRLVSHLGTAGNTEDRAVSRSQEWIDLNESITANP